MSYLLDKKTKKRKVNKILIFVVLIFIIIYFRTSIFSSLSFSSHSIFRPVITLGNNIGSNVKNMRSFFYSKKVLQRENEDLKLKLKEGEATLANYNTILDENFKLKETLGRKVDTNPKILSAILSKPNQSPYDVLIIDIGEDQGITAGSRVFALGNIPIGIVAEVYARSAKIVLYSTPGEKREVVIPGTDLFMQLVGRGGGNFEMILPRDFNVEKGTEVHLPGIVPYTVAIVRNIISDPRDSFQKALLESPVNIQQLKFVEVQK